MILTFRPENYGWYVVWHCQRDIQEYPSKDYTKEDEEFENLRKDLLNDMVSFYQKINNKSYIFKANSTLAFSWSNAVQSSPG